jgi:hypothetical protein
MISNSKIMASVLVQTWEVLAHEILLALNDQQQEFLLSLMQLEPHWDLLPFKDLEHYPGVLWKFKNIQKMSAMKRTYEIETLSKLFMRK